MSSPTAFRLFNTLGRPREVFQPIQRGKVGLYVCGVTAYDNCHLGHARSAVVFDLLTRFLREQSLAVTYVRNFTDIDDKILARSQQSGIGWDTLAQRYIESYQQVMARLQNVPPTVEPKATDHIGDMVAAIERLLAKGVAYRGGSDLFYAVRRFPSYGKLSGKKIEELTAGARVEIDENKRDPLDFALWKGVKPGEPSWPAPFGEGRPGWHIECSVMSLKYLGPTLDIHGGGRDLIFPHHENERALGETETGQAFARCWVHNGFVNLDTEKMSKSTGQFKYLREVLDRFDAQTVRHFLLSAHYGSPLDYSTSALEESERAVARFYTALQRLHPYLQADGTSRAENSRTTAERALWEVVSGLTEKIELALSDDLNTPMALGALFEAVREINRTLDHAQGSEDFLRTVAARFQQAVEVMRKILGLFTDPADLYLEGKRQQALEGKGLDRRKIEQWIVERSQARRRGDFTEADAIRKELAANGIELKDRPDGTTDWWMR